MDDREVNIELITYADISQWNPTPGDVIIKHGWFIRTKWYGVVNTLFPDGTMDIIKGGMMKLVVAMDMQSRQKNSIRLDPAEIKVAYSGSYTVVQHSKQYNQTIWYV